MMTVILLWVQWDLSLWMETRGEYIVVKRFYEFNIVEDLAVMLLFLSSGKQFVPQSVALPETCGELAACRAREGFIN